jgi:hypothetical protein
MQDRDDAERATTITRNWRCNPRNLITPRPLHATLSFRETRPQNVSFRLRHKSGLTPGITRRPEPLLKMKSFVSAVGCRPLLGIFVTLKSFIK